MPGYGSVSKVARRSSTCSLEKLVLFLRLALRAELLLEAMARASSEGGTDNRFSGRNVFRHQPKKLIKRQIDNKNGCRQY